MYRSPSVTRTIGVCLATALVAVSTGYSPVAAAPETGIVEGTVFHDVNQNGVQDAGESGEAGIEVRGYDDLGNSVGPVTSGTDGQYSLPLTGLDDASGGTYRIEFVIPSSHDHLESGPVPAAATSGTIRSGSSIQFSAPTGTVAAGAAGVDFGVAMPSNYCQANPDLVTSCFIFGDQSADIDALVSFGATNSGEIGSGGHVSPTNLANDTDIGTTVGLAWHRSSESIFSATFAKRATGWGPDGSGAIYTTAADGSGSSLLVDLGATAGGTVLRPGDVGYTDDPGVSNQWLKDANMFEQVGQAGLGDLEMSPDGTTLYAVGLADSSLYEIPISPAGVAGAPVARLIPDPGCVDGVWRPFGLGIDGGDVLVGGVCDATSGTAADLEAHVRAWDGSTWSTPLSFPLDYDRRCAGSSNSTSGAATSNIAPTCPTARDADWNPWLFDWTTIPLPDDSLVHPQPMLTDIEVLPNGNWVLGLRDRFGDQVGNFIRDPIIGSSDTQLYEPLPAGDILMACAGAGGAMTLESAGSCGGTTSAATSTNQGPGGGEFFFGEYFHTGHDETSLGGLIAMPNGDLVSTVFDTFDYHEAGVTTFGTSGATAGEDIRRYQIYGPSRGDGTLLGKANGLGDLSALCDAAPVQIGNRVWLDVDGDGLQDPAEPGIAGVVVTLLDSGGGTVGTTTTDADGEYYFDIDPHTTYTVTFDPSGASNLPSGVSASALELTTRNVNADADDTIDSDAVDLSGVDTITVGEHLPGENDHTYDVGYTLPGLRIGNLVWFDQNNDGLVSDGELPFEGVDVEIYADTNANNTFDVGTDDAGAALATITTDAAGNWWFEQAEDGVTYFAVIPDGQTGITLGSATVALDDYISSTGAGQDLTNNNTDNNDDGAPQTGYATVSGPIDVTDSGESTGEEDENTGAGGSGGAETYVEANGATDLADDASNLTVDLGFYQPLRVGNLVWLDEGSGTGSNDDNGVADSGEVAIDGVLVQLYSDDDGTAGPSAGDTLVDSVSTDGTGNYWFDGLVPGSYWVGIPADQSTAGDPTALDGLLSSTGVAAAPTAADNTDDGDPATGFDAQSSVFTLAYGSTATGEQDFGSGADAEAYINGLDDDHLDTHSELHVDFGFVTVPDYRIGNLVWLDQDNDGVAEVGEPGIAGVLVELWADDDGTAGPSAGDTFLESISTDSVGHYEFDGLLAGDYFVVIPDDQSTASTPTALNGFYSSTNGEEADPDADGDNNDNGASTITGAGPDGITSGTLTVGEGSGTAEPTTEVERSGSSTDDDADTFPDDRSNLTVDFGFYTLSVGNQVFIDSNNNGQRDVAEPEVPGVDLQLFAADPSGNPTGPVLATDTTNANGRYLFDGLDEGDYVVVIPATEFDDASDPLFTLRSSTGNTAPDPLDATDEDDNGLEPNDPAVSGVRSAMVTLTADQEPTNESGPDNDGITPDGNENLTVDFGFWGLTLGNRVFLDTTTENGVQDGGEPGVGSVVVDLYTDTNGDGLPDDTNTDGTITSADRVATTTTDSTGHYLFTGLVPGDYVVGIPTTNFAGGPLAGYASTEGNDTNTGNSGDDAPDPDDNADLDDNGVADATGAVYSSAVTLSLVGEPTNETDVPSAAHDGPVDENANVTVDFGFVIRPSLTLGNRVWYDADNDRLDEVGEPGIADVTVNLYRDANDDGVPDDISGNGSPDIIQTDTTDATGHYLFTGLDEGTYIVEIPATELAAGGDLEGLFSSTDLPAGAPDPDTGGTDLDDNGADPGTGDPVRSAPVTLSFYDEPTDESDIPDATHDAPADDNANVTVDFGFYALSLGNQVWYDIDNDGVLDAGEPGIADVWVELWRDSDGDGLPDDVDGDGGVDADDMLDMDTTDADGLYLFTGLESGTYLVAIPAVEWADGGPLEGLFSSTGDSPADDDVDDADDGIDPATFGDTVWSSPVVLGDGEPTSEPGEDNDPDTPDPAENLTVDFGFYALSLGNQVWYDIDNDGVLDAGEPGIADVWVELWRDSDGDGLPDDVDGDGGVDADDMLDMDTTDADGLYLFTGLPEGTYLVAIPDVEWVDGGPLDGYRSSTGDSPADDDVDDVDDGIDPAIFGDTVWSSPVVLGDGEPTSEPGEDNDPDTPDPAENLTVDFGFTRLSLGNQVWFDTNNNGEIDSGEPAIPNVWVELWRDSDGDGLPDDVDGDGGVDADDMLDMDTTDADGLYLFTGLEAGSYLVSIPAVEWADGGPLEGLFSSTGDSPADDDVDDVDDGIDPATFGDTVWSSTVTLAHTTEPTAEPGLDNDLITEDANENLTVDFGFYALRLGNTVFTDYDDSGIQDPNEPGIENVWVELWRDSDGDGLPDDVDGDGDVDADDMLDMDTTDADGRYLFEGLPEGTYLVAIPSVEWDDGGPLDGWRSSTGDSVADDDIDITDDGIDPATVGDTVWSSPVELVAALEPSGEPEDDPATDVSNNLTVDFGFVPPAGLGDYVWFDTDMDGIQDPDEDPVPGVDVYLFTDADGDGQPDDTNGDGVIDGDDAIDTMTTDAAGWYSFLELDPGTYIVWFDPDSLPDRTVFTDQAQGDDGGIDSNPDPTTGFAPPVTIGIGEFDPTIDAGIHDPVVDLTIDKTLDTTASSSRTAIWLITVTNAGPDPERGDITVVDDLPVGLDHTSASGDGWTCSEANNDVTCVYSRGLAVGETTPVLTVNTAVGTSVSGAITNGASVLAANLEIRTDNNDGQATFTPVVTTSDPIAFTGRNSATLARIAALMIILGLMMHVVFDRRRLQ